MKFRAGSFAVVLVFLCKFANASFVSHGQYSTDTSTKLDWLDVTATAGLSFGQVSAGMGGWLSSGWRYASGDEVRSLFTRYVGTGPEVFADNYLTAQSLIRQMGVSNSCGNTEGVNSFIAAGCGNQISIDAFFDDGTANGTAGLGELLAREPGTSSQTGSRWVVYNDFWQYPSLVPSWSVGYGSFLVRAAIAHTVPEPGSFGLVLAGLGAMGALVRRCNAGNINVQTRVV